MHGGSMHGGLAYRKQGLRKAVICGKGEQEGKLIGSLGRGSAWSELVVRICGVEKFSNYWLFLVCPRYFL